MRIPLKKSLGQNFLVDRNIRNKIIKSLGLKRTDIIFEIGTGSGELTRLISNEADKVYSVEIDKRLCSQLSEDLKDLSNLQIINQDILKLDLAEFCKNSNIKAKLKIFGNVPYYISTPILEHLIQFRYQIDRIFITVQREFARRISAKSGSKEYGSLSCFVQYYMNPRIRFDIGRNCFSPVPKVDSSFLEIEVRGQPLVKVKDEAAFFQLIRSAFGQRRKTLRNSLEGIISEEKLESFFRLSGLERNIRPERLTLENFAFLSNL